MEKMDAMNQVAVELRVAMQKHKPFNSTHEGYAVILEELDELKAECWKNKKLRDPSRLRLEARQVAAMAIRFMIELT
jgi:hypothetical protein